MSPHHMDQVRAFALEFARLVVWLALLAAIFAPLERLFAIRRQTGRMKHAAADVAFYFMSSLVPVVIMAPPLALLAATLKLATPAAYAEWVGDLPLWARLVAGLAISELGGYWAHRWCHEVPWLWRFHVVHHAPEHIDWLVSSRAHPVDQVFEKLCALVPLYILGLVQPNAAGVGLASIIAIFGTIWGFFIHANVRWRMGPLEWLIATPAFHHWHHTNDEHRDHNYAATFPVVDRLFGTHYLPAHWPPEYGVDAPQPDTMAEQLLRPLGFGGPSPGSAQQARPPGSQ